MTYLNTHNQGVLGSSPSGTTFDKDKALTEVAYEQVSSDYYQIGFVDSAKEQATAWIRDTTWTVTRTTLTDFQQLPQPVKESFAQSDYQNENITGIDKTERYNISKTIYTLHFIKDLDWADSVMHDLHIDEDGLVLETLKWDCTYTI